MLQLLRIHIALEGVVGLCIIGCIQNKIPGPAPGQLHMCPGGVKMHVVYHILIFFHQGGKEHLFRAAALVGGEYVFMSGYFGGGLLQPEITAAAGI